MVWIGVTWALAIALCLCLFEVWFLRKAKQRIDEQLAETKARAHRPFDSRQIVFTESKKAATPVCLTQVGALRPRKEGDAACDRWSYSPTHQQIRSTAQDACVAYDPEQGDDGLDVRPCSTQDVTQRFLVSTEDDQKVRPITDLGKCLTQYGFAPCTTNSMMTLEAFN